MTPYKDDIPYFSKINMFGDKYPPRPVKQKGGQKRPSPDRKDDAGKGDASRKDETGKVDKQS